MSQNDKPNSNNTIKSSFDLKDLMNGAANPQLQSLLSQQLQNMNMSNLPNMTNSSNNNNNKKELSKEEIRKKLNDKIRNSELSRMGKNVQQQNYVKELKSNPIVKQMGDNIDINTIVEQVMKSNNLPDNKQQRKSVKRQVEGLVDKMKKDNETK